MKGQSEMLASVLLLSLAILATSIVGLILMDMAKHGTADVENNTATDLSCVYNEFYAENASFDANGDCTRGVNHSLTITIRNTGDGMAKIDNVIMDTDTGNVFYFYLGQNISAKETKTFNIRSEDACVGIINQAASGYTNHIKSIHIGSVACPSLDTVSKDYITSINANQSESKKSRYLMGLWHFNSSLSDSSGNANNGAFVGGTPFYVSSVTTNFGNALQMDGINDRVKVNSSQSLNITGQITIEAWVKSYNADTYIITKVNSSG